jgi:hypothetical protein
VPRHVARLVTRLVVDYFASRRLVAWLVAWLVVDYFAYARAFGWLGSSRGSLSTTSTTPRVQLLWHVVRHVARLVVDYFSSRMLVVNYFAYAARPGASARRAARHAARRRLLRFA